ncbi:hypothetical protein G6F70_007114 [Rhizopus microsporus]|uniref:Uncharacterized protein n=2 Tax=Rhizopus TaxID=4842 RepID=A0A367JNL2_RHIAZ|nr:hypothetical protein G6F71_007050 [Rhizopus microsporus]RCH91517.1 hypothetical protein CU097_009228 [Rhizopus azygosporus]KAG1196854.1 hypothetical protein G6F70_007114 [Rhizopus microsporus]KAG1209887.1 hypothetical protein G6F69_005968 [Rhizopus microsporus]KAG1230066.1 hypothetical protein G6F67_006725 [Rhizopus microsporus]
MFYIRSIRPKTIIPRSTPSLKRTVTYEPSKPFPPPQPTRPVEMLDQKNDKKIAMSPTLDAVAEDMSHKKNVSFRQSHHFDTYKLLTQLESQGFSRKQAEVIMKGIKFRLRECTASMKQQLLLSSDLENESYLFKAALSELRTEIQVLRRNDMQMLQSELTLLTREVDILEQRLNEGIATMKNDIQMDMNNRKNETREDQKTMDMKIQEINNKFTIRLGDIRTEIEAVRWETIWKGMTGVCLAGLTIATLGYLLTRYTARKADRIRLEEERKRKRLQEEANRAGTLDMEVIY